MSLLLKVDHLSHSFPVYGGVFRKQVGSIQAVKDVSFSLQQGETLGVVGESGCGKTTLGRALVRLYRPTSGKIIYQHKDITDLDDQSFVPFRKKMQMIFQDPYASLNPRKSILSILEEPYRIHRIGTPYFRLQEIVKLIKLVGLDESCLERYPHEFSGGQRQRISIARSLILKPNLIIADEPVSALDVSIQSQVLNLLIELQKKFQLTYIFISHDLSVVKYISQKVIVMYLGKVVEQGSVRDIFERPKHPYTKLLLSSVPNANPHHRRQKVKTGEMPSPAKPPPGCVFHTRCAQVKKECKANEPKESVVSDNDHRVACHLITKKG